MPDFTYEQKADFVAGRVLLDWRQLRNGVVDESRALAAAVIIAVGTDALAGVNDQLPDLDSTDRRGWWGDLDAEEIWGAWPVGSLFWLLERAKITSPLAADGGTVARAEAYAIQCIKPFVDAKIASRYAVSAQRAGVSRIDVGIQLYRGPKLAVDLRYAELWDKEGVGAPPIPAPPEIVSLSVNGLAVDMRDFRNVFFLIL